MKTRTQEIKRLRTAALAVFVLSAALAMPAFAKVERVPLKANHVKTDERLARQNLKHINVDRIQDPEAKKAIKEILRYLRLKQVG